MSTYKYRPVEVIKEKQVKNPDYNINKPQSPDNLQATTEIYEQYDGDLHDFFTEGDGEDRYVVGLVEKPCGRLDTVCTTQIRFRDR